MGDRAAEAPRYKAFLSYSHKDAAAAARLHRALESYRLPKRLVGRGAEHGPVPQRLLPIFRDRDELPASSDLSERVRAALAQSEALIVLCSPEAAASHWVASEIETFRAFHPRRPVLAAIVAGEPPGCFPAPLRFADAEGEAREPLATDLRRGGDGPRLGLLKLVAGLTGVGLDELVQRDASRRVRRVTAVTGVAIAAMLIMALLTVVALGARREADQQRAEAEGLIEFMLTDLRQRLKGVGRVDALTAANARALAHYGQEDLSELPPDALIRRSRILHVMGEDYLSLEQEPAALAAFREAHRTTAEQLAREPANPERIFAHSQSEHWVGYSAYRRRNFAQARAAWQRYRDLAESLVAMDPRNPDWMKEAGYAQGNLCTLSLEEPVDAPAALEACSAALQRMEQVRALRGDDPAVLVDLANRHGWLVNAWDVNGRWDRARYHQARHEEIVARLIAHDPRNMDYRDIFVRAQFGFGERSAAHGQQGEARRRFAAAAAAVAMLRARDPGNADWRDLEQRIARAINNGGRNDPRP